MALRVSKTALILVIEAVLLGLLVWALYAALTAPFREVGAATQTTLTSAQRHHIEAVHHAARVRNAQRRRAALARNLRRREAIHGNYRLDAIDTNTVDWACIRLHEEGVTRWDDPAQYTNVTPSGVNVCAYGFVAGGPFDVHAQDALALSIFHGNGDHFGPTAWTTYAVCGLR